MTDPTRGVTKRLPLAAITLDPELQPRAEMDRATYEDYGQALVDGGTLPPVLVVADREANKLWLADGYHRWHAHKALGLEDIAAELHPGTRADALRLSLAANATHGKRREPGDYRRAYGLAVKHGLAEATDVEGVRVLLRCSGSWAEKLTKGARDAARAELEAAVRAGIAEGKSVRRIAEELGASKSAVDRLARAVPEAEATETGQVDPDPPHAPVSVAAAAQDAEPVRGGGDTQTPEAKQWHAALQGLRAITALPAPEALFAARFAGFDHVFGPELRAARAWISDLHERFAGGRETEPASDAGSLEERADAAIEAGAETYFAECRAAREVPSMAGLQSAVREAVAAALGSPAERIVAAWIAGMDAANAATPEREARSAAWAAELETADKERVAAWIAELEAAAVRLGLCRWPAPRPLSR